ncbi:MAG: hypothetical protein IKI17_05795 [Oscillospiraceae bacterium]|nr:hypothetical protein [Oscillospiraceae bacterium]
MKNLVILLLAMGILLSLPACGGSDDASAAVPASEAPWDSATSAEAVPPTDQPVEEDPGETVEEAEAPEPEWYEFTEENTDSAGYLLKKKLKISQWISENDPERLSAAWERVGKGNPFPTPQSMGFHGNYISNSGKTWLDYDEIYYAVGQLDVYNETDGWNITKDNTRDVSFLLNGANNYMILQVFYGNGTKNYYRVANGVFGTQGGGWSPITGKMQSNHWGPAPFVLAFAIDRTPEYPDGHPSIFDCAFRFGDASFSLVPVAADEEEPEAPPMDAKGFSRPLLYAQTFSEGVTWVRYEEADGSEQTAAMNIDGDILFVLAEPAEYLSAFHDGTAFYTVSDTKTDVLIGADGAERYRTCGSADDSVKQERICGYANGAYLLVRQVSGMTEKTYELALMKPDGTMQMDYTNQFTSLSAYASAEDIIGNLVYENTAHDRGAGWCQVGSIFINFDERKIGRISYHTVISDFLPAGKLFTADHVGIHCFDTDLNDITDYHSWNLPREMREMKDGVFFWNKYNFDTEKYEAGYYDTDLNLVLAVDDFPDNKVYCTPFSDGLALMEISGKDKKTYLTMIDSEGTMQFEPVVIQDYYPSVLDGLAVVEQDHTLWLMDSSGALVHAISADFPGCVLTVDSLLGFREGWLLLKYSHDRTQYFCFYPGKPAADAGAERYDLGLRIA